MATLTYCDTHVVVWLTAGRLDLLSPEAERAVGRGDLRVSPMVVLELEYLHEIGRLAVYSDDVIEALRTGLGMQLCEIAFRHVVAEAVGYTWTRDPFDRLIVAQASVGGGVLVTRDKRMRANFDGAVW